MKNELSNKLNAFLANLGVEYIKLHNLHWNVVGKDFKPVHEYLESLYDETTEKFDEVAELLKQHDVFPSASMKEYLQTASVKELPSKSLATSEAIEIVLADITSLRDEAVSIRSIAIEDDVFDVVALMEEYIVGYNKTIWFIKSMLA